MEPHHSNGPLPYGSTFRPPPLPPSTSSSSSSSSSSTSVPSLSSSLEHNNKPRGGVQVLPPMVPPRGPLKSKPKPPVPPKRDQLTRLTTVPTPPPPPASHNFRDEAAKPLEVLERKINSSPPKTEMKPNYENTTSIEPPLYASINPETKKLPNSDSKASLGKQQKESSSDEEGATADIWVRAIDSPVKKPDRMFRSNSTSEEKEERPPLVHRASLDNAFIKPQPNRKNHLSPPSKPEVIVEQKEFALEETGERGNDLDNQVDTIIPGDFNSVKQRFENDSFKQENRENERLQRLAPECPPGSRPSSRATSRSSSPFGEKERKKISAAEALGVVAKPCPRPPPGKRIKNPLEFRRQSLGNLSDSKLSMGCSTSCPSHQLWSSFGECHENEPRRHERTRGQSADSRTLQRLKSDSWETQSYSSTLSRIGKYSTSKYFAKTATCPERGSSGACCASGGGGGPMNDRPKSTSSSSSSCQCGRHTMGCSAAAVVTGMPPVQPRDVGKRTFSVEELRSGGFVRGTPTTGSARSSFGKSPRVTFALSEDEGASSSRQDDRDGGKRMSVRAQSCDSEDRQSNRSQPAIGLKQTPKARPTIFGTVATEQIPKDVTCRRSLPQTTPPGVANCSDLPSSQDSNPSQDNAVVYREGNLVSGRLEALIQHMVPTADYYPDRAFLFAFLLTSRLFIKPHDLLGKILSHTESQLKAKQASPKERAALLPRLVQLLGEWSETFPYDFRDERVMSHVRDVAHRCVSVEGPVRQEVSLLLHNLLYRLKKLEQYEAFLHSIHTEATTSSLEALSQTDVHELCGSAESLAQQLTHIEIERLSYIGPEEFVQAFAKESPALETSFKDMKQTRNLESYVSWFNRLSYFVATEVCKHIKSKKQRVRVVEFWVETARECFNIGNFNSLMAIIAGLNMSPISRLKRTWSKVQCAKFSVLEHQMDPSCNFSSYRSTLKAAVWRSAAATDDSQRIVIPFFSLLVKDLYFLNEGCSNKLPNGHINFEKFWQLAKQVTEFITWKQVHCPFPKSAKVITYLQATPVLNEDALALASFECEPPENHEKDRYKTLKADQEKANA